MKTSTKTSAMSESQLETILEWAAKEGWNPGVADAKAFHAADPEGFFLTEVNEQPIAAVSVANHSAEHAFLGLYICHPDWRGRGLGIATWTHGIEHAGARSIGLDGVPDQQENYRASGFVKTGSSMRHEGRIAASTSPNIRSSTVGEDATLIALDGQANGYARPRFLRSWLQSDDKSRGTRVMERDGEISGFATWRACRSGTKIGPIVAPNTAGALALISDIANIRRDGPLIVDVPEANSELRQELEALGFSIPFVTARMYRGTPPTSGSNLQAIATMELG